MQFDNTPEWDNLNKDKEILKEEEKNQLRKKLKELFSDYLNYLNSNLLNSKMIEKIKLDNISLNNLFIEVVLEDNIEWRKELLSKIFKNYSFVRVLENKHETEMYIKNNREKIFKWEYLISANFLKKDENWDSIVDTTMIFQKNNIFRDLKEKVKDYIKWLLPSSDWVKI